jgi:DNA mismatch endonuclease, patch repair protein
MQSVGTKNTGPEIDVRRLVHGMGYRFRLHRKDLPGTPDIVFPGRRKVIFVHGCYWHGHGCDKGRLPKSRLEYWGAKVEANCARDRRNEAALVDRGWRVLTVWQCELRDSDALARRLRKFLDAP